MLLWLLAVLVGILVTADPDLTLPKATGLLLGLTLWRTLVVQGQAAGQRSLALALFLLAALAMIALGAAGVDWRVKVPLFERVIALLPAGLLPLPEGGPSAVHANQLAGTILLGWPLSLALVAAEWWSPRRSRWVVLLAAMTALIGAVLLLLAQSRAGWVGGAAGLLALLWLAQARRGPWTLARRRTWLALAGVGLLLCLVVTPVAGRWLASQATPGTAGPWETLAFRFEVWRYALEAMGDFPLTGTGLGTFRQVVLRLYPVTAFPNPDVAHAHNVFFQVALDVGLPGLVAYLALLLLAALTGWHWLRGGAGNRPAVAMGVLASLLAFHVFGLIDTIAPGAKPGLLFWWLLGLLGQAERPVEGPEGHT
jgi:putative inorganic carbon (HCO3(-)) transporter